jgi:hypothetical protein
MPLNVSDADNLHAVSAVALRMKHGLQARAFDVYAGHVVRAKGQRESTLSVVGRWKQTHVKRVLDSWVGLVATAWREHEHISMLSKETQQREQLAQRDALIAGEKRPHHLAHAFLRSVAGS